LLAAAVVFLVSPFRLTVAAPEMLDEVRETELAFAARGLASFLDYRVMTHNTDCDQVIREYLKVICGRSESVDAGSDFNARIDRTDLEKLFSLESWSGTLRVGCGCFFSSNPNARVCGDAWVLQGVWRD
jgi:hypothetical protein